MLTTRFNLATGATSDRTDNSAARPVASANDLTVFADAARSTSLPNTGSDYLAFLDDCSTAYARMDALCDRVKTVDRHAGRLLRSLEARARVEQDTVSDHRDCAAIDSAGERVYLSRTGSAAFHEDGRRLSRRHLSLTKWGRRSTAWEDFRTAAEQLEATLAAHCELAAFRERFAVLRRALQQDNPLPPAALKAIEDELDRLPLALQPANAKQAPPARRAFNDAATGAREASAASAPHTLPSRPSECEGPRQ